MTDIGRVGIDLAKRIFHLTAVDETGGVVERKRPCRAGLQSYLTMLPPGCVIAMEACASAHHWGRLAARLDHRVLMMSPHKVAPYMHRNKNDAGGIAEASSRPGMRFVGLKSVDQQQIQQPHRARRLAVRERTAHTNQLHGFLLEYGIESPRGVGALRRRLADVLEDAENELPFAGRALLFDLGGELRRLDERVRAFDARIAAIARAAPACRRLEAIPGIGPPTSTALVASVGDAKAFKNDRELAAWLGLTPRRHSTGGRPRLLGISKHGDRRGRWAIQVEHRRGRNVAAVALANKNARMAWAVLVKGADFDQEHRGKAA